MFISYDLWNAIFDNPMFKIYDPKLNLIITTFFSLWRNIIEIGANHYTSEPNTRKVKFYELQHDSFISETAEKDFFQLVELFQQIKPMLKDMAFFIQDNYEIDVE